MGGVMSRGAGAGVLRRDLEMGSAGWYQRYDDGNEDVIRLSSGQRVPEGFEDVSSIVAGLTGNQDPQRRPVVRSGSVAGRQLSDALAGLNPNPGAAWADILLRGSRREGFEHIATLIGLGVLEFDQPHGDQVSLLHDLVCRAEDPAEGCVFSLGDRLSALSAQGVELKHAPDGVSLMHAAVEAGNLASVHALLALPDFPLNVVDRDGRTPLDLADARLAAAQGDPQSAAQQVVGALVWGGAQRAADLPDTPSSSPRGGWAETLASGLTKAGVLFTAASFGAGATTTSTALRMFRGSSQAYGARAEGEQYLGSAADLVLAESSGPSVLTEEAARLQLVSCLLSEGVGNDPVDPPRSVPSKGESGRRLTQFDASLSKNDAIPDKPTGSPAGIPIIGNGKTPDERPVGGTPQPIADVIDAGFSKDDAALDKPTGGPAGTPINGAGKTPDERPVGEIPQPIADAISDAILARPQGAPAPAPVAVAPSRPRACGRELDQLHAAYYLSTLDKTSSIFEGTRQAVGHGNLNMTLGFVGAGSGAFAMGVVLGAWLRRRANARANAA